MAEGCTNQNGSGVAKRMEEGNEAAMERSPSKGGGRRDLSWEQREEGGGDMTQGVFEGARCTRKSEGWRRRGTTWRAEERSKQGY